ncbi:hypothetical protein F8388_007527 [Cannabis sativa]|uniref:Uncharacterized protein n=1 Tax=Cannabis sativa TaxID=3483 RepID=A0A7J6F4R0_CANSA|nr:hypothetical protein G4B88_025517 [Cannabis sativa]KAF4365104.1 hypothetical protein G4B88_018284 [Cannabis sativa]KAF4365694.1 hypothetical protein F8388_007527 [Cannabis sativa]
MKNKMNLLLRKCKSLSRQLGRSSSYSNLRSNSTREDFWVTNNQDQDQHHHQTISSSSSNNATIFVGSSRKRYVISTKYLSHPLLATLIDKSNKAGGGAQNDDVLVLVNCEVVLFDHLLWMLENADPINTLGSDSLEELAALYFLV